MSSSGWTPSPTVEREGALEARAVRRAGWTARLALLVAITALPLACVGLVVGSFWTFLALGFGVGGIWMTLRAFGRLDVARTAVWTRDAEMIDEFGSGVGWLVDLMVHQGDAPTGMDRGMLWIEDGRLLFAGRRTSFALAAPEVFGGCRHAVPIPGLRHELSLFLHARTAAGRLGVSFVPVERAKWQSGVTVNDVREALDRWVRQNAPGESDLPPQTLGLDAPSRHRLFVRAAIANAYWLVLTTGVLSRVFSLRPFTPLSVAIVGLIVGMNVTAFGSPADRLRAWWDRRGIA